MNKQIIAQYWPKDRPNNYPCEFQVAEYPYQKHLKTLFHQYSIKYSIELGSWYGESALHMMKISEDLETVLFCIDYWDNDWAFEHYKNLLKPEHREAVRHQFAQKPLYETFLATLWSYRHRLVPLKMDTLMV